MGCRRATLLLALAALMLACGGSIQSAADGGDGAIPGTGSSSGASDDSGRVLDATVDAPAPGVQDAATEVPSLARDASGTDGTGSVAMDAGAGVTADAIADSIADTVPDSASDGSGEAGGCAPGTTSCIGNAVQVCDSSGQWGSPLDCGNQACVAGGCIGVCRPGSTQCSGSSVEVCGAEGAWGSPVPCVNQACVNGACMGVCAPGDSRCVGTSVQTCDSDGQWGSACAGCFGCGFGVCSPGATQCSNNGVQTCSNSGAWGTPVDCGSQACVAGVCVGACDAGACPGDGGGGG